MASSRAAGEFRVIVLSVRLIPSRRYPPVIRAARCSHNGLPCLLLVGSHGASPRRRWYSSAIARTGTALASSSGRPMVTMLGNTLPLVACCMSGLR